MEEFNYQAEQSEVPRQWFPFSRMGTFYSCILVGMNLIAVIIGAIWGFWMVVNETISKGGAVDFDMLTKNLSDILTNNMAWIMLIAYAITIPLCMLIARTVPKYQDEQKEKWKISKLLLFLMLSIGLMMIGNFVSQIMQGVVSLITGHKMTNPLDSILNDNNILGSIVLVAIIAPFVEEFLFRKVLIDRVRVYGDKVTMVLSGVLFGLFHGNLFQVVYAMLLGMLLAYVYLKTSNIWYCIGLHMVINIIGGVLPLLLLHGVDMKVIQSMQVDKVMQAAPRVAGLGALVLIEISCMIATIVILAKFWKSIVLKPATIEIDKGNRFKTIYLNAGTIIFFVICIFVFITNAMA